MQSTDQDKQMIEDQYDQILRLKHRLTITTCVAFIAIAALVGVSFLFSVSIMARGRLSVTAQDQVVQQQLMAVQMQMQQAAVQKAQIAQQNAVAAQAALLEARRRMLEAQLRQAVRDSEPVVAPVP
jgi:hypothetical protein